MVKIVSFHPLQMVKDYDQIQLCLCLTSVTVNEHSERRYSVTLLKVNGLRLYMQYVCIAVLKFVGTPTQEKCAISSEIT